MSQSGNSYLFNQNLYEFFSDPENRTMGAVDTDTGGGEYLNAEENAFYDISPSDFLKTPHINGDIQTHDNSSANTNVLINDINSSNVPTNKTSPDLLFDVSPTNTIFGQAPEVPAPVLIPPLNTPREPLTPEESYPEFPAQTVSRNEKKTSSDSQLSQDVESTPPTPKTPGSSQQNNIGNVGIIQDGPQQINMSNIEKNKDRGGKKPSLNFKNSSSREPNDNPGNRDISKGGKAPRRYITHNLSLNLKLDDQRIPTNFDECFNFIFLKIVPKMLFAYNKPTDQNDVQPIIDEIDEDIEDVVDSFLQLSIYLIKDDNVQRNLLGYLKESLKREDNLIFFIEFTDKIRMNHWFINLKNRLINPNYEDNICDFIEMINGIKAALGFIYNVYYMYIYYLENDIKKMYGINIESVNQNKLNKSTVSSGTNKNNRKINKQYATGILISDFMNRTIPHTYKLTLDRSKEIDISVENVHNHFIDVINASVSINRLIVDDSKDSIFDFLLIKKDNNLGLNTKYRIYNKKTLYSSSETPLYNNVEIKLDSYLLVPSYLFYQVISNDSKENQKIIEKKLIELIYMYDEALMGSNLEKAKTIQKAQEDEDEESEINNSNEESIDGGSDTEMQDENSSSSSEIINTMTTGYGLQDDKSKKRKIDDLGEETTESVQPKKRQKNIQTTITGKLKRGKKKKQINNSFYLTSPEADYMEGPLSHFFRITCPGPKVILKDIKIVDKIVLNGKYMGFGPVFNDLQYLSNGKFPLYNSTKLQKVINKEKLTSIYDDDIGYYMFSINEFIRTTFSMKYLKLTNFDNLLILNISNNTFPFNIHDKNKNFLKTLILSHVNHLVELNVDTTRHFSKICFYKTGSRLNFFDFFSKHASSDLQNIKLGEISMKSDIPYKYIIDNPDRDKKFVNFKIYIIGEIYDYITQSIMDIQKLVSLIVNSISFTCKHQFSILGPRTGENTQVAFNMDEILPKFTKKYTFQTDDTYTNISIEPGYNNSSSSGKYDNLYINSKSTLTDIVSLINKTSKKVLIYIPKNKKKYELEVHVFQKQYNNIDKTLIPSKIRVIYGEPHDYESEFSKNGIIVQKFDSDELEIKNVRLVSSKEQEIEMTVTEKIIQSESHDLFKIENYLNTDYENIYNMCKFEKLLFPPESMLSPYNEITENLINSTKMAKIELKKSKSAKPDIPKDELKYKLPKKIEDSKQFLSDFKKTFEKIITSRNVLAGCKDLITNLLFGITKTRKNNFPTNRLTLMMTLKYFSMEMLYDVVMSLKYEREGFTKRFLVLLIHARQMYLILNMNPETLNSLEPDDTIKTKSDFKESDKYKKIPILAKYIDMYSNEFFQSYNQEYEDLLKSKAFEFIQMQRRELLSKYGEILRTAQNKMESPNFTNKLNKNNIKSLLLPALLEGTTPQLFSKKNRTANNEDFDRIYKFQDINIIGFGSGFLLSVKNKNKFMSIVQYINSNGRYTSEKKGSSFDYDSLKNAGIIPTFINELDRSMIPSNVLPRFVMSLQLIIDLANDAEALENLKNASNNKDSTKNPAGLESRYKKISFDEIAKNPVQYVVYFYGITLIRQIQAEKQTSEQSSGEDTDSNESVTKKSKKSKKPNEDEDDMLKRKKKKSRNQEKRKKTNPSGDSYDEADDADEDSDS